MYFALQVSQRLFKSAPGKFVAGMTFIKLKGTSRIFFNQTWLFQNAATTNEFDSKVQKRRQIYFLTTFATK
jgi:hypothetical protein